MLRFSGREGWVERAELSAATPGLGQPGLPAPALALGQLGTRRARGDSGLGQGNPGSGRAAAHGAAPGKG